MLRAVVLDTIPACDRQTDGTAVASTAQSCKNHMIRQTIPVKQTVLPPSQISHTVHRQMLGLSRVSRVRVSIRVSVRIRVMFSFSGVKL